jgi:hypothetical protein
MNELFRHYTAEHQLIEEEEYIPLPLQSIDVLPYNA